MSIATPIFDDVDSLARFISKALKLRKERCELDAYQQIVKMLGPASEASLMRLVYKALTEVVSELDVTRCPELFAAILDFNWAVDQSTVETHANFLLNLVSANRDALKSVLNVLLAQLKAVTKTVPDEVGTSIVCYRFSLARTCALCRRLSLLAVVCVGMHVGGRVVSFCSFSRSNRRAGKRRVVLLARLLCPCVDGDREQLFSDDHVVVVLCRVLDQRR